jgi:hypothetical protein
MPADTPPGKRVWISFDWIPRYLRSEFGFERYIDIVAKAPFDVAFPADRMQVRASEPFVLVTRLTSNFAEPVEANLQLDMPGLIAEPLKKTVHCEPGVAVPVEWSVKLTGQPESSQVTLRAETGGHNVEQSRYLSVRPTRWVVADLTKTPYTLGQCLRGQAESSYDHLATLALVYPTNEKLGEESLESFHMHPPYKDGKVGYVFACFDVALPEGRPALDFSLGFGAGSTTQDGCVFKVIVVDEGKTTDVFSEQYATLSAWARRSADLSAFAGKDVKIKLVADVGPADNSYSDWALWGAPEIVMDEPAVEVRFLDEKPKTELAPPPEPLAGLARADLAKIASAKLTLDTAGVDGGPYTSYVYFNGVKIGTTPTAGDVQWAPGEIPLSAEALRSIGPINTVVIKNPNQDFMKVRALCLHFVLDDGRRGSSWVDTGPYCSAAGWPYDEGISVPVGSDLPEMVLTIPLEPVR